jgi:hypothetical protein
MRRKKKSHRTKHAYAHLRTLQRAKRNFARWWSKKYGKKFKGKPALKELSMKRAWSRLSIPKKMAFGKAKRKKRGGGWWPPPPPPGGGSAGAVTPEPMRLHGEVASASWGRPPPSRVHYQPTRSTKEKHEAWLRKKAMERAERERRVRVAGDPKKSAEAYARSLTSHTSNDPSRHKRRKRGLLYGLARRAGKKPSDFNQRELAKGTRIEMEHTTRKSVARQIAMDHLTEDPRYYAKMKKH